MDACEKIFDGNNTSFALGCDNFYDGLVCWPQTLSGRQARVDCLNNVAFEQALKQNTDKDQLVYFAPYIEQESGGLDVWYKTEPWLCHSMLATLMFCFQSPIFWMFIEGIYLHAKVSTNIFNQPPPFSIYYFIGWGLPLLVTLVWVISMELTDQGACWDDYSENNSIYIIVVPILSILMIRKAVQSTLILFPLLGITNLLFFINPKLVQRAEHQYIYMLVNSILKSSQGISMSLLYCFFNSEVQKTLKRLFKRNLTRFSVERSATRLRPNENFPDVPNQSTLITEMANFPSTEMGCQTETVTERNEKKSRL